MNRALLVHQPTDGGVGRHVRDLANGLAERGYEIVLCAPEPLPGLAGGSGHRRVELRRAVAPRADIAAARDLARIVGEVRPDVVHAHSSKAGAVARLARVFHPGVPLLYSPHGYSFNGHFERPAERSLYRTIERVLAPAASRVTCVCEAEARLARAIGPAGRVRVIHNGVQAAQDTRPDDRIAALSRLGPVVGALTLLRPGKGLETLIDALAHVRERHPHVQVAISGDGPDLDSLRARAAARGVAQAVHFLGVSTDPLSALAAVDVFVHPSWAESFPYVILEAMSLGKPIVASRVGGIEEAIVDGSSGLLAQPRDALSLARALTRMLDDPAGAARMGEAARRRTDELFALSDMLDAYASTYEELHRERSRGVSSPPRSPRR